MGEFNSNIIYPEFSTYTSLKLNSAPQGGELPPSGYIYQWESIIDDEVYKNYLFHDGTLKSYPLKQSSPEIVVDDPQEVSDLIFTPSDIQNNELLINNNFSISQIGFYTDNTKTSWQIVNIPIISNTTNSRILFNDIDQSEYAYGGIVKFARGITILNYADTIYKISQGTSNQTYNAELGLIQEIESTSESFIISHSKISNLKEGDMMKIFVNNTAHVSILVEDESVDYDKFCVCYINIYGSVQRIGDIIKVGE